LELRIFPIIAGDDAAAIRAIAPTFHSKTRIRFCQRIVVGKFLTLGNVTARDEIAIFVEPDIPIAGMVHVPLDRKPIEVILDRWNKPIGCPNTKGLDFFSYVAVELIKAFPWNEALVIRLGNPFRDPLVLP
jgi:hypothetical protein